MKHVYLSLSLVLMLALVNLRGKAQLLSQNFNTGSIPSGWTQSPATTWSMSTTLGVSGSACIMSEDLSMSAPTNTLRTSILNLTGITNLTITFKAAVVRNNFISPNITLSYNAGSGTQFLARWGSGFTTNTTYTINDGADYQSPLDAENIVWETCTHTISAINGSSVSFAFNAEFVNGGYVLIDDLVISGKVTNTTGINKIPGNTTVLLFPNPVVNTKLTLLHTNTDSVFIYDHLGKNTGTVFQKNGDDGIEADLSHLSKGIYFVTILASEKNTIVKRIIVE